MSERTCSVDGCERIACARGWCKYHWTRWRRDGSPTAPFRPRKVSTPAVSVYKRAMAKVQPSDGCWLWTGSLSSTGYGTIGIGSGSSQRRLLAHRLLYEMFVGPIPSGLQIDHLCRVRHCVNPAHLEPVTLAVNVLRGVGRSAMNAKKTHCLRGHEFTPQNTYIAPGGSRHCRTCETERARARYATEEP